MTPPNPEAFDLTKTIKVQTVGELHLPVGIMVLTGEGGALDPMFAYVCSNRDCGQTHIALKLKGIGTMMFKLSIEDAEFLGHQLINPQPLEHIDLVREEEGK